MMNKSSYYRVGLPPTAQSAATVNGSSSNTIDREAAANVSAENLNVIVKTGAATGTPTDISVVTTLYHSRDNGVADPFTQWTGDQVYQTNGSPDNLDSATIAGVTASNINSIAAFPVDLRGVKRYFYAQQVISFTGGTSPTILTDVTFELSGCKTEPVT